MNTIIEHFLLPYDVDFSIYYDVHLSCNLAFPANEVTWGENSQFHFQHKVV